MKGKHRLTPSKQVNNAPLTRKDIDVFLDFVDNDIARESMAREFIRVSKWLTNTKWGRQFFKRKFFKGYREHKTSYAKLNCEIELLGEVADFWGYTAIQKRDIWRK